MHNDLFDIKQTFHVDCFESVGYEDDDFYVYLHFRNDTGYPFYVGKGKGGRAFYSGPRRSKWWENIVQKCGYTVRVIEKFKFEEDAFEFEKEMITILKELGFEICNLTDGGEGTSGYRYTEEQKKKRSESAKIAMNKPEVRTKKSESAKIAMNRPDVRKKISEATKIALGGSEVRAKMSEGRRGEKNPRFSGYSVGINETHVVIVAGAKEMTACGFHQGAISDCILGKRPHHKKFKWSRHETLNPSDFAGLIPFNELSAERLKNSQ